MIALNENINLAVVDLVNAELKKNDKRVISALKVWFIETPKNSRIDNIDELTANFERSVDNLSNNLQYGLSDAGNLILMSAGSGAETLSKIRYGTTWFKGMSTLEDFILKMII